MEKSQSYLRNYFHKNGRAFGSMGYFILLMLVFVEKLISENFDLSPRGIREMLGLNKPIYEKSAAYGHFGREPEEDGSFSWEKTDKKTIFSK